MGYRLRCGPPQMRYCCICKFEHRVCGCGRKMRGMKTYHKRTIQQNSTRSAGKERVDPIMSKEVPSFVEKLNKKVKEGYKKVVKKMKKVIMRRNCPEQEGLQENVVMAGYRNSCFPVQRANTPVDYGVVDYGVSEPANYATLKRWPSPVSSTSSDRLDGSFPAPIKNYFAEPSDIAATSSKLSLIMAVGSHAVEPSFKCIQVPPTTSLGKFSHTSEALLNVSELEVTKFPLIENSPNPEQDEVCPNKRPSRSAYFRGLYRWPSNKEEGAKKWDTENQWTTCFGVKK